MTQSQLQYKVLITPLISQNTYGETLDITADIDISEFISEKGIGKIKSQVDNGDYDFGIFSFTDITLNVINYSGKFNDESSSYSIFTFRRDLAKVKVQFTDSYNQTTLMFEGIINDEATRQDNNKGTVKFKVLSYSSIFNKTKIPAGIISNGTTLSAAIERILNLTDIKAILNFDSANLNVGYDTTIDDGSKFDNKKVKDAINQLLLASSSILYIDDSQNMIVTTRSEEGIIHNYFGGFDRFGRENILKINKFNNGLQRMFNSIDVNGVSIEDPISINRLGIRTKSLNFDFLNDSNKYQPIANRILDDFKFQRTEMEMEVRTKDAKNVSLLDLVTINYTAAYYPANDNEYLPLYGISKYGEDNYPLTINPLPIRSNELFKVIGIFEDPKSLKTVLKLRSSGKALEGGVETLPVYGQAVYGSSIYQAA